MLQATICDGGTLDVLTFGDDGLGPAEVDVGRGEVIDAFVIADVIVVFFSNPATQSRKSTPTTGGSLAALPCGRAALRKCKRCPKATEQPIDTSTAAGKAFLDMLGVFAEFETNLRKDCQLEGIAKAKDAGVYKGRPASIDAAQVRQLKAEGLGPSKIAKALRIGRASVYRALAAS